MSSANHSASSRPIASLYHPLSSSLPDEDRSVNSPRQFATTEKFPHALLSRVERDLNSTRFFWLTVGLFTGVIVACAVFVPLVLQSGCKK